MERGVEDDPDVHAAVLVVNGCVDRGGIVEFVDGDTDRTDRNADQTDDGGVTGAGLLDQLIVRIGRVRGAARMVMATQPQFAAATESGRPTLGGTWIRSVNTLRPFRTQRNKRHR